MAKSKYASQFPNNYMSFKEKINYYKDMIKNKQVSNNGGVSKRLAMLETTMVKYRKWTKLAYSMRRITPSPINKYELGQ